ncbi:MAG: glycogen/starch synthase [Candidatus Marinimicrobia bacterium]|nr:glycogen/starch synthase [Candidatus Neomarinimicrobiota bacterium]
MSHKIYFLSTEVAPFASAYSLGAFSRKMSSIYHEDPDIDIRLLMPKYGFISERKYILREVIRLKDIKATYGGEENLVNIKSAFIPNTRVQVYFMIENDLFKPLQELIYKSRNGRPFKDNDEKFSYFSYIAIRTLKNLYWKPDFIFCNDWQTAMVPKMLKDLFLDDEFYEGMQTVYFIHSINEMRSYTKSSLEASGLKIESKNVDGTISAIKHSALTILMDDDKGTIRKEMDKNKDIADAFDSTNNLIFNVAKYPKPGVWDDLTSKIKSELQKLS